MEISLPVFIEHAFASSSYYYFQSGCGLFLMEIWKQMQCVLWKQTSCLCKSGATAWKLFSKKKKIGKGGRQNCSLSSVLLALLFQEAA